MRERKRLRYEINKGGNMRERKSRLFFSGGLAATLFLFVFVGHAIGQVLYGSLVGTVTDQSGAVVPGAQVTGTSDLTGVVRQSTTGSSGVYQLLTLPAGPYTLKVSATGFKPITKLGLTVTVGQINEQNLQLEIGGVTEQVTVTATGVEVLQTEKSDVHTEISSQAIENLPLDIYRNFQAVELLTPGIISVSNIENNYPNSLGSSPDRSLAINANGLPQHMDNTRVDGATNQYLWLADHMLITPPAETIEEANVQTSNFDVQRGLTAGAAVDVVTKSGTNSLHGTAYGFNTNQTIDAGNLFAPTKPKNIHNNDGFTLGGPILKKKLFFFGGFDGYYQSNGSTIENLIPPVDMRSGNFSGYLGPPILNANGSPITVCTTEGATVPLQENMIFDPSTGDPTNGTGRCVFSSGGQLNVIPSTRIYPGAAKFLSNLRAPGDVFEPFTANTPFNDIVDKVDHFHRNVYTAKVDGNISDRQLLWVKYMAQSSNYTDPYDYGLAGGNTDGYDSHLDQIVTIGHSWTPKPNLVLNGHIGYSRMRQYILPPPAEYGQPLGQSILELGGSNLPAGNILYSGLPAVSIGGFSGLGGQASWMPFAFHDWTLMMDENATLIHGNHQISFGFEANHNHLNEWDPEINCCQRGSIFTSEYNTFLNLPADPANPGGAQMPTNVGLSPGPWNGAAEFDLGLTSEVQKAEEFINETGKEWQLATYVGDRWKVKPNLTADIGVRWEYFPLLTRDGAVKDERYVPATNTLLLGGLGGNPPHLGITTSRRYFAPRIGFAYRLHDNTVIRSAFGIFYDTLPLVRPLRGTYPENIQTTEFVPSTSVSRFQPYNTFQQGVPIIVDPDIAAGSLQLPPYTYVFTLGPGPYKRAYAEEWNFTVERRLPKQVLLTVGYVGNHLVHELNGRDINAAPLGTGGAGQPLSIFGQYNPNVQFQGYLDSHYNSLQVSLDRRLGSGLTLQGAYTYSKVIGYINDAGWANSLALNCPPSPALPQGCQQLNRGALSFDHTQVLKMSFIYPLPFGEGQRWVATKGVPRALVGGWQINGIFTAFSGDPMTITQDGSFLNTPDTSAYPNFVGPLKMIKQHGPGQYWFNPNAFQPVETAQLGTSGTGLSWLRGPGVAQLDFSLFRNFKLSERFKLQFRAETQNLTNTPHFYDPSTYCAIVNGACGGSFGQISSSFGERIVQLGLKVTF